MSCITFFAPLIHNYQILWWLVIHCCTSCCGVVVLCDWCCEVAAAVYRVITLPAMPGHAPADHWTYTHLWRMSQQSQHQTGSSLLDLFSVCLVFVSGEDVSRLSHCHCDILWMCARPGRGATPFPSIIISNDQKINRNSPSYKKHGTGLHLNKWKLSVSKMYMTWNGIFKMFVPP